MYLVTGGAGFIGSNVVAALAAEGRRVAVCDRLGRGDKWRNLAKHEVEDLIAPEDLFEALDGLRGSLEAVVHMGAVSDTTEDDADRLAANNFRLSKRLWQWCAARRIRLVYASSAATYGDGGAGFDDDAAPAALARLRPLNAYGWSKHAFDRWAARRMAAGEPAPPQWAGLKFFNVYGPNEYHKGGQASVVWHLFQQARAGGPAKLYKSHHPDYVDGGQMRDFVWVGDCVAVVRWLLAAEAVSGLFNVGTGKARTFADLARALFRALGEPENIEYVPTPEAIRARYQYFTEARVERLRSAGFTEPFTELEDGVERYVRRHLTADDPYR